MFRPMKKTEIRIDLETVLKGVLSVCFIVVFYVVLSWIGFRSDLLSPWKQAIDSYRLSDMYFSLHKGKEAVTNDGTSVVLVDISSCRDRDEIAGVIDRINRAKPLVVALDVIFPPAVTVEERQNDSLVRVLGRACNLVLAKELRPVSENGYVPVSSFFVDDLPSDEGLVTLPGDVIRTWCPLIVAGNDTIPSFTKCIADKAGIYMPDTVKPRLIDYSIHDDMVLDPQEQWDDRFLCGQVVLVGDMKDARDTYEIPVTLKTSVRQSGVSIHRQILLTCIKGMEFRTSPQWLVILLSSFLLFIVSLLIFPLLDWSDRQEAALKRKQSKASFKLYFRGVFLRHVSAAVQIGMMALTAVIGYIVFWTTGYYFEAEFLLVGYALLYMSHGFTDAIVDFAKMVYVRISKKS